MDQGCSYRSAVASARFLNLYSSRSLSCNCLLFPIVWSLWNDNGCNTKFCNERTLERATKLLPAAFSALPKSTTTWGKVWPCDLWIVMAYRNRSGSCCLESLWPSLSHSNKCGGMGTVLGFVSKKAGTVYREKCTSAAMGRQGGGRSGWKSRSYSTLVAPLQRPTSCQRLHVSITAAPRARNITASRPPASSDVAFLAFLPEWRAAVFQPERAIVWIPQKIERWPPPKAFKGHYGPFLF